MVIVLKLFFKTWGYESGYSDRKEASGPMQCLELGYESGRSERKQAWQALYRPSGPMQRLQLGYESGRSKHKQSSSSCDGALRPVQSL